MKIVAGIVYFISSSLFIVWKLFWDYKKYIRHLNVLRYFEEKKNWNVFYPISNRISHDRKMYLQKKRHNFEIIMTQKKLIVLSKHNTSQCYKKPYSVIKRRD